MSNCATHGEASMHADDRWGPLEGGAEMAGAEAPIAPAVDGNVAAARREFLLLLHADFALFGAGPFGSPNASPTRDA